MIARLQDHLEAIYGFTCEARAEAFVVDTEAAVQLGGSGHGSEELLVSVDADGEGLELALYLAPSLLARLKPYEAGPLGQVLDADLDGYCQVTEGVSHFLYVAHTAHYERTVSLLELEAQAEVDKFAVCLLHRWGEGVQAWAGELRSRLFDRVSYPPRLSSQERWRYEEANRLSRRFCSRLMGHVIGRRLDRLLGDLRYAYRLGAEAKLRHFAHGG
ncbi:hypothetical protein DRW03_23445 [Corallococcus sp. H22C18031201]|uniref:hypothetical protein n=1 Tax=Citreicoccus inhibens TaxID=2849499 RepID=UPI000E75B047|nr:hypothetical protein [Citreicoccus inhibens]MBU8897631.1 hypothetical protein [Citreicoccus inhibens]RJS19307.1 hypothetical protein DRW03_23445 [Corallococcus sp. H22C18031201]